MQLFIKLIKDSMGINCKNNIKYIIFSFITKQFQIILIIRVAIKIKKVLLIKF